MKTTPHQKKSATNTEEIDIEQKQNEIAEEVQNIFNATNVAIGVLEGPEHKYSFINPVTCRMLHRTKEELIGKTVKEVFPEVEAQGTIQLYDEVYNTGKPFAINELSVQMDILNDGITRQNYFNLSCQPLRDSGDKIYAILITAVDVTEQVEARKKTEESEKRYNTMLMQSPFAFAVLKGKDMVVAMANDSIKQMWGKGENVEGKPLIEILPEIKDQEFPALLHKVYTTGIPYLAYEALARFKRKGKMEDVYFNFVYQPYRETDNTISGVTVIAIEVTPEAEFHKKIKKSEEKYRTLLSSIDQGFTLCEIIRNKEGKAIDFYMLEVNPSYEEQTGVSKEMVLGKRIIQTFPSLNKWMETYAAVVDNQCPVVFEHYFEDTDRWFAIKAYPVDKERFAVLFSNITERKLVEEKLKENDIIFKSIPDAIISSEVTGRVISWNECAETLYGFSKEEMIGQKMPEMIPTEILNKEQENWQEIFAQKGEWKGEVIQTCKDGKKIYVSAAAHVIRNTHGEIAGYVAVNRDITIQKEADIKIKESEKRFRSILLQSPNIFVILEGFPEMIITFANEPLFKSWGRTSAIIGKPLLDVLPELKNQPFPKLLQKVFETGKLYYRGEEKAVIIKNGVSVDTYFIYVYQPVFNDTSKVTGVIIMATDITEQVETRKKVEESEKQLRKLSNELEQKVQQRTTQLIEKNTELVNINKELEAFTFVSSHDMQEPLRKIQTFAGRILEKENQNLSDNGKNYFRLMQQSAERMQQLIQDLLDFSRLSLADRKFETTDLNIIIEEIKNEFKDAIDEKKAVIEVKEICDVKIIPFQFRQLMQNLISNALKFSNPKIPPHITIKSRNIKYSKLNIANLPAQKEYCHISIIDNGIGFEKEFAEKIFEVFQRLHGKEEYAGTGIGLAIVKKIVENHNGIITATSELNKGTTFDIYLPV